MGAKDMWPVLTSRDSLALSGGMGLGGLYSPIPSSPVGGYDDYFGSGGCSEGDLETKRCSNVIKKLCTAGNITEVSRPSLTAPSSSVQSLSPVQISMMKAWL